MKRMAESSLTKEDEKMSKVQKKEEGEADSSTTSPNVDSTRRKPTLNSSDGEGRVQVKRLSSRASIPVKADPDAAGYDLTAPCPIYIPPGVTHTIGIEISVQAPKGYYGRVAERSGLAKDYQLKVRAGVIDRNFSGELKLLLANEGAYPIDFPAHSRVAQLIIEKIHPDSAMEEVDEFDESERNERGFGSTGI